MIRLSVILLMLSSAAGTFAQEDIGSFEKQFKKDLKKKKWEQLAQYFDYPFSSYDWGYYLAPGNSRIDSKEEFLIVAKDVLNDETIKTMLSENFKKEEILGNGPAYILVYNRSEGSTSWLVFQQRERKWKAVKTDNVSR